MSATLNSQNGVTRSRQPRGSAGAGRRENQSAPIIELPLAHAAALKLIGILLLSEINGDRRCRELAFSLVKPEHFADPALATIWSALKALQAAGEPLTPDRIAALTRPQVPDAAAILAEAMTGVYRAVTTADTLFYAEQVVDAADARRLRMIVHDAGRELAANRDGSTVLDRLQIDVSALAADRNARQPSPTSMFDRFEKSILNRERPKFIEVAAAGSRLREIKIGPGNVTLFGAPPGAGKTACVLQLVVDALRQPGQENLKALVANVEMSPEALLTRQLARLSGVGHAWLLHRDFDEAAVPKLQVALDELRALMPRLEFMSPPFTLERLAERAKAHEADVVVVDYAQRFDFAERSHDSRAQCNAVMDALRRIVDQGRAVVAVSALNRAGYAKETAGLASFRESSELEYGADSAWLLAVDPDDRSKVALRCVKHRAGELTEIPLKFDGSAQSFIDDRSGEIWTGVDDWPFEDER